MWKKPKKKKVLAPVSEFLKKQRIEDFEKAMEKSERFFETMKKIEEEERKAHN